MMDPENAPECRESKEFDKTWWHADCYTPPHILTFIDRIWPDDESVRFPICLTGYSMAFYSDRRTKCSKQLYYTLEKMVAACRSLMLRDGAHIQIEEMSKYMTTSERIFDFAVFSIFVMMIVDRCRVLEEPFALRRIQKPMLHFDGLTTRGLLFSMSTTCCSGYHCKNPSCPFGHGEVWQQMAIELRKNLNSLTPGK